MYGLGYTSEFKARELVESKRNGSGSQMWWNTWETGGGSVVSLSYMANSRLTWTRRPSFKSKEKTKTNPKTITTKKKGWGVIQQCACLPCMKPWGQCLALTLPLPPKEESQG